MATQVHRLARTNYSIRAASFAYAFLIVGALANERSLHATSYIFPVLVLFVYPHLAWWYARRAPDSHRAELHNLLADAAVLGLLVGQFGLPLWLACGVLLAITVNNAICAGAQHVAYAVLIFGVSALGANLVGGFGVRPETGPLVGALSALGMIGYATSIGLVMHRQNSYLIATRDEVRKSEQLFRVIAEHAGELVLVLDPEARIAYSSDASYARLAPDRAEPEDDWARFVHAPERSHARRFVESLLRSRIRGRAAFHLRGADGSLIVMECEGTPVIGADGEVALLVLLGREFAPPG